MDRVSSAREAEVMRNALEMRRLIRNDSEVIRQAKEENISLVGRSSKKIAEEAATAAELIMEEYGGIIMKTWQRVAETIPNLNIEDAHATFQRGMIIKLKQYERLHKTAQIADGDNDILVIAQGYALNFLRSLRYSAHRKETAKNSLNIASLSYKLPPNIIERLRRHYPEVDLSVIKHAAQHNPTDPERFINNYLHAVEELAQQFPEVDLTVIKHAAQHYPTDPQGFINNYLHAVEELALQFPEVDLSVIQQAARNNPAHPERFINNYLHAVEELAQQFPEVNLFVIKRAALHYPTDPVGFLREYLNSV